MRRIKEGCVYPEKGGNDDFMESKGSSSLQLPPHEAIKTACDEIKYYGMAVHGYGALCVEQRRASPLLDTRSANRPSLISYSWHSSMPPTSADIQLPLQITWHSWSSVGSLVDESVGVGGRPSEAGPLVRAVPHSTVDAPACPRDSAEGPLKDR